MEDLPQGRQAAAKCTQTSLSVCLGDINPYYNMTVWILLGDGIHFTYYIIHSGHQLDEPMGFSGGLGQQSLMLYLV